MDQHNAEKKEGSAPQIRYSGFWVRWAARIIDCVVLSIVIFPLMTIVGFLGFIPWMGFFVQIVTIFLGAAIAWSYFIIMTEKYQATLGKMAVGAIVVSEDGNRLSMHNIIMREILGKFISGIICNIGFLIAAFTKKKQGLHDFIGKSVVVYKDPSKGPNKGVVATVYILFGLLISFAVIVFSSIFLFIFASIMMAGEGGVEDAILESIGEEIFSDEESFNDELNEFLEDIPTEEL